MPGGGGEQGDRQTDDPINGNCDGSLSACMTAVKRCSSAGCRIS